jgi:hypothetical protein
VLSSKGPNEIHKKDFLYNRDSCVKKPFGPYLIFTYLDTCFHFFEATQTYFATSIYRLEGCVLPTIWERSLMIKIVSTKRTPLHSHALSI